ncbi:MAG: universal stress protein [Chloroflexota bacterium]
MFKKILVPLDGSTLAEEAIPTAAIMANKFDGDIYLVSIILNIPQAARYSESLSQSEEIKSIRDGFLEKATRYLSDQMEASVLTNDRIHLIMKDSRSAAEGILEAAEEVGADSIIMSTHGRSGINRWVFGSVAEKVLRGAKIPILLIRSKRGSADGDGV